eukprot:TRINITY_DN624_c10_g1_i1.p1 TRINITY_DN624_c10_g1~~TRINITY_DN624_c10_g1_i1.p1  ORF type:complete len:342 (+),score=52.60 TRINITY_DN624_c10_g1_i1:45-1028(+)
MQHALRGTGRSLMRSGFKTGALGRTGVRWMGSSAISGGSGYMLGALAVVGAGGTMYAARLRKNKSSTADDVNDTEAISKLSIDDLRKNGVILYRYLTCPFCGKLKAFLDYQKIPYQLVEVDPLFKSQMKGLGYSKVPFIQINTENPDEKLSMGDSYEIVSSFGKKANMVETEEITKWRKWVSEELVRYMTLNLSRTMWECWDSAAYIDTADEIPAINKFLSKAFGAPIMYLVVNHFVTRPKLKKLGYSGVGDEREALFGQLDSWISTGVSSSPFHGGKAPSIADVEVYGVINALRGYPLYSEILEKTTAREWIGRMDKQCGREPFVL